jgi:starch synthase
VRVVHVASEVAPWAATGGLADVVAALPAALAAADRDVACTIVAPLYRGARDRLVADDRGIAPGPARKIVVGPHAIAARISRGRSVDGVPIAWIDAPALFDRDGIYGPRDGGGEFADNHIRYGALCRIAVDASDEIAGGPVDLIHGHDWQGALAPAFARLAGHRAATVQTIHNLAFRGLVAKAAVPELGLSWSYFDHHHYEFWDQLSLLKAGLAFADAITTVSPGYAREIATPIAGEGLDGFLAHDVAPVVGIVNGIDTRDWDPARDPAIAAPFSAADARGKQACKRALAGELGLLVDDDTPVIAVIARMTDQKGVDLIADVVPALHRLGARMVVLGTGEPALESRFRYLGSAFRDHLAVRIGFDPALARRIYAGADLFAMPSRFEPCGLGQLYAMRYGAVPVVRAVGGLRDTVDDGATGFVFDAATPVALYGALDRAVAAYREPDAWTAIVARAMRRDSSWTAPARAYLDVYRAAIAARRHA